MVLLIVLVKRIIRSADRESEYYPCEFFIKIPCISILLSRSVDRCIPIL